ncbi:HEAT repeat domain-containing protein [candidate division KSB1 bacterium]|nr:HEAT repeat domain-containing protein [candidate division KSB1 bacterium]
MSLFVFTLIFLINLFLSILVAWWLNLQFTADRKQAWAWTYFGFCLCFFVPGFGLVGTLVLFFTIKRSSEITSKHKKINFQEHLRKERVLQLAGETTIHGIKWADELELQPLVDALQDADVNMRKGAITALAKKHDPVAIKHLSDALENTMLTIRYFAVEALGKISKEFGDRILAAQKKLEKQPHAFDRIMELADCYFDFATSNVEDVNLSHYYLVQAASQYHQAIKIQPQASQVSIRLGEIYARLGDYEQALTYYEPLYAREENNLEVLLGMADAHLKSGNFKKLREITQQLLANKHRISEEVLTAASMWVH